ncbi:MAG: pseudouridine synthase [Verrucomicrobiaceae bacterium]|nr:pseudouridine synthase [Verrucomicrobiaceae bacterium]
MLSQFTREHPAHRTLAEFGFPPEVYPIGRLDRDSEGLILLSDETHWTDRLLNPRREHPRAYHSQVEGVISADGLSKLRRGVKLKEFTTLPCKARRLDPAPPHPPRDPPIRYRASIPTSWIELELTEGKNRQVRRMTAAAGFPTLRLIRVRIGGLALDSLQLEPGGWRALSRDEEQAVLGGGSY